MLSIDVGSKRVCIIEGNYIKGKVHVISCGEIEYKDEVVVNGEVRDRTTLGFIINEIIKTNHMKSKQAVVTINSSDIISRELKLPDVKLPDLQQLVRNEMLKLIGSENDFVIDFVVKGTTDDHLLTVMAYVVSQEMVESYYTIIKDCKLTPLALDVHANSMSKLLSGATINGVPNATDNIIVADIGFSRINFHGFSGGTPKFNRTEFSPVQDFVRELSSLIRAESQQEMMQGLDLSPNFGQDSIIVAETCRYFVSRIADEIQKYSQYITINSAQKTIPKIYICGGVSLIKGIDLAISDIVKTPIEILTNVDRAVLPENCDLQKVCNAAGALIRLS